MPRIRVGRPFHARVLLPCHIIATPATSPGNTYPNEEGKADHAERAYQPADRPGIQPSSHGLVAAPITQ
jgi:hypothetical protein